MWNAPLMRELGGVAPASGDWTLGEVLPVFTGCAVALGITTATLGPWAERAGPRFTAAAAAAAYGTGCLLSGIAVDTHQLWMLHLGY